MIQQLFILELADSRTGVELSLVQFVCAVLSVWTAMFAVRDSLSRTQSCISQGSVTVRHYGSVRVAVRYDGQMCAIVISGGRCPVRGKCLTFTRKAANMASGVASSYTAGSIADDLE